MAFTLLGLMLSFIPASSIVPAKRVKPFIGVTATLASTNSAGIVIPVSLIVLIRYPFPACIGILTPNLRVSKGLHEPAAISTSSAFSFLLVVITSFIASLEMTKS